MLTAILAILVVVLLVIHIRQYIQRAGCPSFPSLPILGHSLVVVRHQDSLLEWLLAATETLGSTWCFKIVGQPLFVCISKPEDVKHVLSDNFINYVKGDFFRSKFYELLGDGIFDVDGDLWKFQRKTASHQFKRNELKGFSADTFVQHGHRMQEKLDACADSGKSIDLQDLFFRFTLESIGKIAFGTQFGCFDKDKVEFATNFDTAQQIIMERTLDPIWSIRRYFKWIHPRDRLLTKCVKNLDNFAMDIIRERRKDSDVEHREDLLSRFMNIRDDAGKPLTDYQLRDVIMSFVIAGRDTTANALSWVFYELYQNPDVEKKLLEEIHDKVGQRDPTHEDVHERMPYLHAVVKETLRLHPSVSKDVKIAVQDDTLPTGIKVKAGSGVIYMPWVMGRLEELWGPDASKFDPERWQKMESEPTPFKYLAFNAGPRLCLGMNMAYIETKIAVVMILQKFVVTPEPGQDFHYQQTLTLPIRDGLHVKVAHR